jgi:hypothetical protein
VGGKRSQGNYAYYNSPAYKCRFERGLWAISEESDNRMNFIYKCYLQKLFSSIHQGERLNFLFQKYVTNRLPVDDEGFIKRLAIAKEHFDAFTRYTQSASNQNATHYEFGAGGDLIDPIGLSLLGIQTLYCIDIRDLTFPELLNDTISKLYRLKRQIPFGYSLPEKIPLITASNFKDILRRHFRVHYSAPGDARHTKFRESTIDLIVPNITLEHIPKDDIVKILQECYRILKKDSIISCRIDCTGHWSHFDHSISIYNFLRHSPSKWQQYNPPLHYQNRLRHRDYLDIILQTGFEVL